MTTQQFCAIVSASPIGRADVTVNLREGAGAAEAYETAISLFEAAGVRVIRRVQNLATTSSEYEVAHVNPDADGFADCKLIGPMRHAGYQPDELISPTPEGRLAMRVIQGGAA